MRSIFSQSNREYKGEFSELRGYMLAKLICDPYSDSNEIMDEFLIGYYKQAAPFISDYINTMHDAMEHGGGALNIFGAPADYDKTYLTPGLIDEYQKLFDMAESAVESDSEILFRVKTARMPLHYAIICLSHGTKDKQIESIIAFASQSRKIGLEKVEEWKITVDQFITESLAKIEG